MQTVNFAYLENSKTKKLFGCFGIIQKSLALLDQFECFLLYLFAHAVIDDISPYKIPVSDFQNFIDLLIL
jgi:hypothetical protein